ncbi:hypothetical protein P7C70_g3128, partial [Phenoliferia sp. Uapishka_3]
MRFRFSTYAFTYVSLFVAGLIIAMAPTNQRALRGIKEGDMKQELIKRSDEWTTDVASPPLLSCRWCPQASRRVPSSLLGHLQTRGHGDELKRVRRARLGTGSPTVSGYGSASRGTPATSGLLPIPSPLAPPPAPGAPQGSRVTEQCSSEPMDVDNPLLTAPGVPFDPFPGFSTGRTRYTHAENSRKALAHIQETFEKMLLEGEDIDFESSEFSSAAKDIAAALLQDQQDDFLAGYVPAPKKHGQGAVNPDYFPFRDEKEMWSLILDSNVRHRISRAQKDNIKLAMEGCGVKDLPSREELEATRARLQEVVGARQLKHIGHLGNVAYVNDIRRIVKQELCNPLVREKLRFLPEDTGKMLTEMWAAEKWSKELAPELLTQAVVVGGKEFYVNEVTPYGQDGELFFPTKFFTKADDAGDQVVHARGHKVWLDPASSQYCIDYRLEVTVSSSVFWATGLEYADQRSKNLGVSNNIMYTPLARPRVYTKHRELRHHETASDGCPGWLARLDKRGTPPQVGSIQSKGTRVLVPLILYGDDSSGNHSKKWNKHVSFYMCLAGEPSFIRGLESYEYAHTVQIGLPAKFFAQEYNIHFLSTSNVASPLEQLEGIVDQINSTAEDPILVHDIDTSNPSGRLEVEIIGLLFEGHNPMHAELSCQKGMGGLKFCRCCHVGATSKAAEETAAHIAEFMKTGIPQDRCETEAILQGYRDQAASGSTKSKINDAEKNSGTADLFTSHFITKLLNLRDDLLGKQTPAAEVERLMKAAEASPECQSYGHRMNPMLSLKGYDFHRDTPVEILHTVLLGFVKYLWRDLIMKLNDIRKERLRVRLRAFDTTGCDFSDLNGDTLVRFAQSLVGKDFRHVLQSILFTITGEIPQAKPQLAQIESMQALRVKWKPADLRDPHIRQTAPVALFIRPLRDRNVKCPMSGLHKFERGPVTYLFLHPNPMATKVRHISCPLVSGVRFQAKPTDAQANAPRDRDASRSFTILLKVWECAATALARLKTIFSASKDGECIIASRRSPRLATSFAARCQAERLAEIALLQRNLLEDHDMLMDQSSSDESPIEGAGNTPARDRSQRRVQLAPPRRQTDYSCSPLGIVHIFWHSGSEIGRMDAEPAKNLRKARTLEGTAADATENSRSYRIELHIPLRIALSLCDRIHKGDTPQLIHRSIPQIRLGMSDSVPLGPPLVAPPESRLAIIYDQTQRVCQHVIQDILDGAREDRQVLNSLNLNDRAVNAFALDAIYVKRSLVFWAAMVYIATPHLLVRQIHELGIETEMWEDNIEEASTQWKEFVEVARSRVGWEASVIRHVLRTWRARLHDHSNQPVPSSCGHITPTFDFQEANAVYAALLQQHERWNQAHLPKYYTMNSSYCLFRRKGMKHDDLPDHEFMQHLAEGALPGEYRPSRELRRLSFLQRWWKFYNADVQPFADQLFGLLSNSPLPNHLSLLVHYTSTERPTSTVMDFYSGPTQPGEFDMVEAMAFYAPRPPNMHDIANLILTAADGMPTPTPTTVTTDAQDNEDQQQDESNDHFNGGTSADLPAPTAPSITAPAFTFGPPGVATSTTPSTSRTPFAENVQARHRESMSRPQENEVGQRLDSVLQRSFFDFEKHLGPHSLTLPQQWSPDQRLVRIWLTLIDMKYDNDLRHDLRLAAWKPEPDFQSNLEILCRQCLLNPTTSSYRADIADDVLRIARVDLIRYSMGGKWSEYCDDNPTHVKAVKKEMGAILGNGRHRMKTILLERGQSITEKVQLVLDNFQDRHIIDVALIARMALIARLLCDVQEDATVVAEKKTRGKRALPAASNAPPAKKGPGAAAPATAPAPAPAAPKTDGTTITGPDAWRKVDEALEDLREKYDKGDLEVFNRASRAAYIWHEEKHVGKGKMTALEDVSGAKAGKGRKGGVSTAGPNRMEQFVY